MLHQLSHPLVILAALLTLVPYFYAAFCPSILELASRLPIRLRILAPALLGLPYALVSWSTGLFRWPWLVLFTLLLDAGIYGFLAIRQLRNVGFDLRLRLHDFGVGLFALAAYTPIAVTIGL